MSLGRHGNTVSRRWGPVGSLASSFQLYGTKIGSVGLDFLNHFFGQKLGKMDARRFHCAMSNSLTVFDEMKDRVYGIDRRPNATSDEAEVQHVIMRGTVRRPS